MDKIWKQIHDWQEYEVSNYGEIKRISKSCGATAGKILKPTKLKNGYLKVSLCRNSKRKEFLVHRLVAITFIGDAGGMDVCHIDGTRDNNNLSNLRIDTRKGNMQDSILHGTMIKGSRVGTSKYKEEFILEIKNLFKNGATVSELARKFNIPKPTLYGIKNNANWKWL
jgi:hypothetical protein